MDAEWWVLVCILGVIFLVVTLRLIGPVLADLFCGRIPGGRK